MKKFQRAITQFWVGSHRLGIELGWHQKPCIPVEKLICKLCNSVEIDEEYHFLVHCEFHINSRAALYSHLRQYKVVFDRLEDDERFKQMLISTNKMALHCLRKFIHDGFWSRDLFQVTDFHYISSTDYTESFFMHRFFKSFIHMTFIIYFKSWYIPFNEKYAPYYTTV